MPLLSGNNGSGDAITIHDRYIEIENFQITKYRTGIQSEGVATNVVLKNIIMTSLGSQSNSNAYDGFGFNIEGNNTLIENCFVLNANAEGIKLFNSDYSRIKNCEVYATNSSNPTDYYYLLTGGTNNSIVEYSLANRAQGLSHNGHGFTMKDLAENNIVRNCTARRTTFEFNFSGVKYNTIDNCKIYGVDTSAGQWDASMTIANGANNNLIKNLLIENTWAAVSWVDYDDGYVGQGGDRDQVSLGYNNTFENLTVRNTDRLINAGAGNYIGAKSNGNKFINCNVSNFNSVAVAYFPVTNISFQNCSFNNGQKLTTVVAPHGAFGVTWQSCTWSNVNFTPPN